MTALRPGPTASRPGRSAWRIVASLVALVAVMAGVVITPMPAFADRAFTVTVRWVDTNGVEQPVAGGIVRVELRDVIRGEQVSDAWSRDFTADSSGVASAFVLQNLDASEVRVSARAPGGAIGGVPVTTAWYGQSLGPAGATVLSADWIGPLTIVLHPVTTVTGSVVATDGVAVGAGASVVLWHRATSDSYWRPVTEVTTNGIGRFSAAAVPVGDYRFEVRSAAAGRLFERSFHPVEPSVDTAASFIAGVGASTDVGSLLVRPWALPTSRLQGATRFETAVRVAQELYPEPEELVWPYVVFVVNGQSFADSLGASALAANGGGVLLLTEPDRLPGVVANELRRLNPENIVIVGGTGVVSTAVENAVRSLDLSRTVRVVRAAGNDRYATSRALIDLATQQLGYPFSSGSVFLATGTDFPDALGAAAAAGSAGIPLILVGSVNEQQFSPETEALLDNLGTTRIFVAGGSGVVSGLALNRYSFPRLIPVVRFGGIDRFETNRMINEVFFPDSTEAIIASGTQFPDALAAGPLSSAWGAPLVLTSPSCVTAATARALARDGIDAATLVGGPGALGDRVAQMSSC